MSTPASALAALAAALETLATTRRKVIRGPVDVESVPADGVVAFSDGDPGEPEGLLGGLGPYVYQHHVELVLAIQHRTASQRVALFDALAAAVGAALETDISLGGAIDGLTYGAPRAEDEPAAPPLKTGAIDLVLHYDSPTRI